MGLNKDVKILGSTVTLEPRKNERLKGTTIGERILYRFYDASFRGVPMLFVEPKKGNPTPKECHIAAGRLTELFRLPVVFTLAPSPTYERQRLMDKGVYFVMSDKYAHLPMLVAVEKTTNKSKAVMLTPVAQYLLLYHLQVCGIEGLSARDIANLIPYSYESTTLGLTCLADVKLCQKVRHGQSSNVVHFELKGEELWREAQEYLKSPVERRIHCDGILSDMKSSVCGINALAHYTNLNPDSERMVMVTSQEYRDMKAMDIMDNPNIYDGNVTIEVWRHPSVGLIGETMQWVDRLSLALSLRDNHDARVEKEVERLIQGMEWKD